MELLTPKEIVRYELLGISANGAPVVLLTTDGVDFITGFDIPIKYSFDRLILKRITREVEP